MPTTGLMRITVEKASGLTVPVSVLAAFEGDEVTLETRDLDLGDDARDKYVDGIQFDISERGKLTYLKVEVWARDRHEDPLIWLGTFPLGNADTVIHPRGSYRYWRLKIRDTLPLVRWKLTKIAFFGRGFDPNSGRGTRGRQ